MIKKSTRDQIDNLDSIIKGFWEKKNLYEVDDVNYFIDLVQDGFTDIFNRNTSKFVYRGQVDSSYGFNSSLYRTILALKNKYQEVSEQDLQLAENALLEEMIYTQGLGRNMTMGQLLMVLQHYGTPTRLIDASRTALEALFFAVENQDSKDGVLFLIDASRNAGAYDMKLHGKYDGIMFDKIKDSHLSLPWSGLNGDDNKTGKNWINTVKVIDHLSLDPRMHAQNGVFLVGGLNHRHTSVSYREQSDVISYDVEQPTFMEGPHTTLSSLSINWLKRVNINSKRKGMQTLGWNIIIPANKKEAIRKELENRGVSSKTLYPGFLEVTRLSGHIIKKSVIHQ